MNFSVKSFTNRIVKKIKNQLVLLNKPSGEQCPVCGRKKIIFEPLSDYYWQKWDSTGFIYSIFQAETLNFLNFSCSNCGASDRDRLFAIYLEPLLKGSSNIKLLDFAPSKTLRNLFFSKFKNLEYRTADLEMPGVDDYVDIQDLAIYQDNSWDGIICSHVLEHVPDDQKALKELYRILKPEGWAVLMVPIFLDVKETHEISNIDDSAEEDRWKYFGQGDHLRMYSKADFLNRIKNAGFSVNEYGVDYFGELSFKTYGIHPRSVLYVATKSSINSSTSQAKRN